MLAFLLASQLSCRRPERAEPVMRPSEIPSAEPKVDLVYFVLVDRFANGDPTNDGTVDPADPQAFHGGDLKGVEAHLDELQALGVRTLVLSPIYEMRAAPFGEWGAYHGYWVEDLGVIEPRFGTEEDLVRLGLAVETRGMRLVLDVVYNHTAPDGRLRVEKPQWFHAPVAITDWSDAAQVEKGEVHGLPDLDQDVPEVHRYLLESTLRWAKMAGADGVRLDAVRHMPATFVRKIGDELEADLGSEFWLLGEVFDGNKRTVGETSMSAGLDAVYDFPLYYAMTETFCDGKPMTMLAAQLTADRDLPAGVRMVTFADNHDLPRIATRCGENTDHLLLFLFNTRGTPALLYGTEAGLEGGAEPSNRGDMVFGESERAGFVAERARLRADVPALVGGRTEILRVDDDVLVFLRIGSDTVTLVAFNRTGEVLEVQVPPAMRGARRHDAGAHPPYMTFTHLRQRTDEVYESAPDPEIEGGFVRVPPRTSRSVVFETTDFPEPDAATREVRLFARKTPLGSGDTLLAVGLTKELGGWRAEDAPAFGPSAEKKRGLVLSLPEPVGSVLAFKLAIRRADGTVVWEDGEDRTLVVYPGQAPVELDLTWHQQR